MNQDSSPPDWQQYLAHIGAILAEAREVTDQRDQAWAGWSTPINWETWETSASRLSARLHQLPALNGELQALDQGLAEGEAALRAYAGAVEAMRHDLVCWQKRFSSH